MKKYQLSILLSFFISALFLGLNTSAQVANSKTTGINFQDLPGKWKTINITADNVFQKKPNIINIAVCFSQSFMHCH